MCCSTCAVTKLQYTNELDINIDAFSRLDTNTDESKIYELDKKHSCADVYKYSAQSTDEALS